MIYILLITASLLWGSNVVVMKLFLNDIHFLMLASLRVFFSMLFLGMYMLYKKESFLYKHKFKAFILGAFSIYLNFFFTFLGMKNMQGIQVAFINALIPVVTLILSVFLLNNKITKYQMCSIVFTVLAFLCSLHFKLVLNTGFIYMIMGVIMYICGYVLIQKWDLKQSLSLVFYQLMFGFIFLFMHTMINNQFDLKQFYLLEYSEWLLFVFISGMGFAFIQVIYFYAIKKIGILKTSFFLSLNPIVTYIGSILFLNETMDMYSFIGIMLIIMSLCISDKKL